MACEPPTLFYAQKNTKRLLGPPFGIGRGGRFANKSNSEWWIPISVPPPEILQP